MHQTSENEVYQYMQSALKKLETLVSMSDSGSLKDIREAPHKYEDKFTAIEFLAVSAFKAILYALGYIGLTGAFLEKLKPISHSRAVTLNFSLSENTTFLRKVDSEVRSDTTQVWTIFSIENHYPKKKFVFLFASDLCQLPVAHMLI
jgi:hypothetical protein